MTEFDGFILFALVVAGVVYLAFKVLKTKKSD